MQRADINDISPIRRARYRRACRLHSRRANGRYLPAFDGPSGPSELPANSVCAARVCRSSTGDCSVPISQQSVDCVGLLRELNALPAHVVGHLREAASLSR